MTFNSKLLCIGLILSSFTCSGCSGESSAETVSTMSDHAKALDRYSEYIEPVLAEYCYDCHGDGAEKGDIALDEHPSRSELVKDVKLWKRVWENLHRRNMPPGRKPQPGDEERELVMQWIEREVFLFDPSKPDPGRVTIRRLNRTEYDNTIRDLTGVDFHPAKDFPADDTGYGFDNIGDVLTLSPVLLEKYFAAADEIVDKALGSANIPSKSHKIGANRLRGDGSRSGDFITLSMNGVTRARMSFPRVGEYRLRVQAYGSRAGKELAKMQIRLSGKTLATFEVKEESPATGMYEAKAKIDRPGDREVEVAFINDFYDPRNSNPRLRDRNLYVEWVEVVPPPDRRNKASSSRNLILPDRPDQLDDKDYAGLVFRKFASRAFRRPATSTELEGILGLYDTAISQGDDWEQAIRLPLKAMLISPNFLFRGEFQPSPNNPKKVHEVDEFALASRLSYFLWSSMPDKELFDHAFNGTLRKNMRRQIRRMLRDPKAKSLASNFAGQWLQLRDLDLVTPDPKRFPQFDDKLRGSMRRETETMFHYMLSENRSILDFLTADYTFVDERLARFYALPGKYSEKFTKASLRGTYRGGILTHASILTVTSNPTRTSPVKRGKWVLDNLLGTPPKDPPENVPELEENTRSEKGLTLREQMQIHSEDARCASCHTVMDPLGFSMENFNAIGLWRAREHGKLITTDGKLPTGESFEGAVELQRLLARVRRESFVRCVAEAMLIYALGRGLEYYDRPALDEIYEKVEIRGFQFNSLIEAIAESIPFQKRRGDPLSN
ncbi:MAG: hypothetical protein CMI31_01825 [Opitutae bacterium]|nr:hypothetical protein [Opitutae bacterium]